MRIYSKTKDYYDSAQAYGQDSTVGYTRNPREIELTRKENTDLGFEGMDTLYLSKGDVTGITTIVGFCGRIYPVVHYNYIDICSVQKIPERYCYSNDDVRRFLRYKTLKKYREDYIKEKRVYYWRGSGSNSTEKEVIKYFKKYHASDKFESIFLKYDTPIWIYKPKVHGGKLIINSSDLGKYEFFKVFNAYQAFQELSMYLTSALAKEIEPDPDNVPDEYLAKAKGFDNWSFRKQPTKRGRKAKKRG